MLRPFILILSALLSACAVPTKSTTRPPDEQRWQTHLQQMSAVIAWDIRGRVAIQTEDNGGQADLFWRQQTPDYYDIKLVLPFGGGTTLLQGRSNGVVLTSADGQRIYEDDPDQLLAEVQGWQFPVSGLRYWLLGIPVPERSSRLIHWNQAGYLQLMEQDGWRIELKSYQPVGDYYLPKKLFLRRLGDQELDVRLVFRQWGLEQGITP
ncbi:MAG: lipoprotein insertase outer membrane protein LolB [Gammaproteobacteria bacterium]|nr:lipoprotein insertase outer membrane protein LolB [Gammaproteobacteria bacterium]